MTIRKPWRLGALLTIGVLVSVSGTWVLLERMADQRRFEALDRAVQTYHSLPAGTSEADREAAYDKVIRASDRIYGRRHYDVKHKPLETGVFENAEVPFPSEAFGGINNWTGYVQGRLFSIYAGQWKEGPRAALLATERSPRTYAGISDPEIIFLPAGTQARITEEQSGVLGISTDQGEFVFDVIEATVEPAPASPDPG
jgi:hypothetical protein